MNPKQKRLVPQATISKFICPRCGNHYSYKSAIPFNDSSFKCPHDGYYFNTDEYKKVNDTLVEAEQREMVA